MISLGGIAFASPVILICNWTGRSTSVSELVRTAVTVGASARAGIAPARTKKSNKIKSSEQRHSLNSQISAPCHAGALRRRINFPLTNRYRQDARACVHQAGLSVPRPSSPAKAAPLASGSSRLPFPARLPPPPPALVLRLFFARAFDVAGQRLVGSAGRSRASAARRFRRRFCSPSPGVGEGVRLFAG